MAKIQPGTRIRLLTALVSIEHEGELIDKPVSLRFDWSTASPEHSCLPHTCPTCKVAAARLAVRHLKGARGEAIQAIRFVRDRQATAR